MAKAGKSPRFVSVGCSLNEFEENKDTSKKSQRGVSLLKKKTVRFIETTNIGARDLDALIANFLLQV